MNKNRFLFLGFIGALAALSAGCGNNTGDGPDPGRITQRIVLEPVMEQQRSSEESQIQVDGFALEPLSAAGEAAKEYYRLEAEKEAAEIEQDILESDFRVGKVSEEEFRPKRDALKAQEEDLERQKEALEREVRKSGLSAGTSLDGKTAEELRSLRRAVEQREDQIDREKEALEVQYQTGKVSREDFIAQFSALEFEDDQLDELEERLEDILGED